MFQSGRLFIRNLPYICKEEDFEKLFAKVGPLKETLLPLDSMKHCIGLGFVTYMVPEDAVRAYTELDGTTFMGRILHIIPANLKKDKEEEITGKV